jgi:putative hydrolase of the HAD superfamily
MGSDDVVTTIIFDVDDTLYDVGLGFSDHRNYEAAPQFMVEVLGFPSIESAKRVRNEYFERYHSTAKALTVAEQEGAFPPVDSPSKQPRFDPRDFDEYLATRLDFTLLGGRRSKLLEDLQALDLNIIAFSNGPRNYIKRVLIELGLWEIFGEDGLFAVGDLLPACKPEKDAFDKIFQSVGVTAEECILVEDSMKNVRQAKKLGLKTVLVLGAGRREARNETRNHDVPDEDDPAVDLAIETVEELREAAPTLWQTPATFPIRIPN